MRDRTIGSSLKAHRASAGLTQEELAERADVSARTVSDVERGLRARVYRDTALRLADALELAGDERAAFQAAARGPRRPSPRPTSTLPLAPTRLIGRERELEIIVTAVERPEVRLLTLTGPGGIGKTRLALEAVARARSGEETTFVQLGTMSDPTQVLREIALAVGVSGASLPTIDAIADQLADRDVLLVLDTFEHVLEAALDVAELLARSAAPTILVTSRQALRIRGEHEVAIPTLDLPPEDAIEEVLASPATALFVERAQGVLPSMAVDDSAAETIADICRRLNGLPLAIELAAARVKHLPLSMLRDQLDHALDVLVAGPRDLPRRQRTMREAIDWSFGLLDPLERQVFLDLSVFSGGWTIEAASAVCGTDAMRAISGLIDKSLVVGVDPDEPRWDMLDVIREFATERRQGQEAERRHLHYFVSMAEDAEVGIGGGGQGVLLCRLAREHDNLRAVLRRAIEGGDAEDALRVAGAIWRFWMLHGDLAEGRKWLRMSLHVDPHADPHARAKAIWGLAWLAYHQGDIGEVEACADELMMLAQPEADRVEMRNALTIRGMVDLAFERFADAVPLFERGVELLRGAGPSWLLATSLLNLGQAAAHAGDQRARSVLEESRELYLELGDQHFVARSDLYLGYAALMQGDPGAALSSIRASLIASWELDDLWGATEALEGVAVIAAQRNAGSQAVRIAAAADALREGVSMRPFPADHAHLERSLARLRPDMDDVAWTASWEAGRAMGLDEAVDDALGVVANLLHQPEAQSS